MNKYNLSKSKQLINVSTLIDLSKDYSDEVDYIIPISGVSPTDFKKTDQKKILGTVDVKDIENKFKFYTKIKDEFQTPKTFRVTDIHEAIEINKNYQHDNSSFYLLLF